MKRLKKTLTPTEQMEYDVIREIDAEILDKVELSNQETKQRIQQKPDFIEWI